MATAVLIAKIFALIYLSISVGYIFNKEYYRKEFPKILDNFSLLLYGGAAAIAVGCLILAAHNTWTYSWTTLITLLGWLALLKGILLIIYPKFVKWFEPLLKGKALDAYMAIPLILGLILGYFGFFA